MINNFRSLTFQTGALFITLSHISTSEQSFGALGRQIGG